MQFTQDELNKILENHQHWWRKNCEGWEDMRADLSGADLSGADLSGANLYGADLSGAEGVFVPYACPDFGMFIGFKKAKTDAIEDGTCIVVLEIPEDAKRLSATGRKCRCDKAKVLQLQTLNGDPIDGVARSSHDPKFIYKPGEMVSVEDFCEDRWQECSAGIHFFINREEAVRWVI